MILTNDPDSKLPHISAHSQPRILVYKRFGSLVDEDHCNYYYHDLLQRANPEKWDRAVKFASEQFPDLEHEKTANFFQVLLTEYFETPVEITGVYTGINQSNGYQYWIFASPKKSKTLEIESKIEPNSRQSESNGLSSSHGFAFFLILPVVVLISFWIFNYLELGSPVTKMYNNLIQELKQQKNGNQSPR
jgi:uncharacterized protein YozE (UPF0346 family)